MTTNDRAAGSIVGLACGDALGAGYEFGPPLSVDVPVTMRGGGAFGWEGGEWTDDTSMAFPLLEAAARGDVFDDELVLDEIVAKWVAWSRNAKDVGVQIGSVLRSTRVPTAKAARVAAEELHRSRGRSAGNGSLMRTAPVALAYLEDIPGLVVAAREVSELTHFEKDAGDACVIWCVAIRHAILTGVLDVGVGIEELPLERQELWRARIADAEYRQPGDFANNGWAVQALQGAWSAIHHGDGLMDTLERAVRGGRDTDTVAAIAGSLAGAAWGVSAIPARWRRIVHGWPQATAADLSRLAVLAANHGRADAAGWPLSSPSTVGLDDTLVRHPHDSGVWMGSLAAMERLPPEVDAVVSLCRAGPMDIARERIEFWLVDNPDPSKNPHLDFVLTDAADTIADLRRRGRSVYLHCREGRSRTPAVAALYSARHLQISIESAIRDIRASLPNAMMAPFLDAAIRRAASSS